MLLFLLTVMGSADLLEDAYCRAPLSLSNWCLNKRSSDATDLCPRALGRASILVLVSYSLTPKPLLGNESGDWNPSRLVCFELLLFSLYCISLYSTNNEFLPHHPFGFFVLFCFIVTHLESPEWFKVEHWWGVFFDFFHAHTIPFGTYLVKHFPFKICCLILLSKINSTIKVILYRRRLILFILTFRRCNLSSSSEASRCVVWHLLSGWSYDCPAGRGRTRTYVVIWQFS